MEKEFKTIEEQIKILKSRSLVIKDEEVAKNIFRENNYYFLINGYKDLFINKNEEFEIYKPNVELNEIYSLYKFDISLRELFMKYVISLERRMDTYIAYEFSKNYGYKDYLLVENFDNVNNSNTKIKKLIDEIKNDMITQINIGNKMLNHYMCKYKYVPLWVLVRIMTFGQVSKFYGLMKQNNQNKIAKNFNVSEKKLKTYISNLAIIRNVCAHDEKLYDIRLKKIISETEIHKELGLKREKYSGFKDIFATVIILKELLKEEDFKKFYSKLVNLLGYLEQNIKSIEFENILNKMGFPKNYKSI